MFTCDNMPSAQKYALPAAARNSGRLETSAAMSRTVWSARFQGSGRLGFAAGKGPINRLAIKPNTATPISAEPEIHQFFSPKGPVQSYRTPPASEPMMIAIIEAMLISPLAEAILSLRTSSGIAPSFEVMNSDA